MKLLNKYFTIICILLSAGTGTVFAQDGTVTTELVPHSKDGIFSSTATYTFNVKSTYKTPQVGKVSYIVTTEANKKVRSDSVSVKIGKEGSGSYDFSIPGLKSGFYKINFMVNVTDYDDTTRKAFGIRPEEIRSQYGKPEDFDSFWQTAKADLEKVKPDFKITEMPDSAKDGRRVFLV